MVSALVRRDTALCLAFVLLLRLVGDRFFHKHCVLKRFFQEWRSLFLKYLIPYSILYPILSYLISDLISSDLNVS